MSWLYTDSALDTGEDPPSFVLASGLDSHKRYDSRCEDGKNRAVQTAKREETQMLLLCRRIYMCHFAVNAPFESNRDIGPNAQLVAQILF